ncbi:glycosyltransferase [Lyngbya aestuarii]|uniref:glycosyltransferase n=1 Tax=Lyngbya aestuarii TaxID=118322 RepID=UPI00403D67E8
MQGLRIGFFSFHNYLDKTAFSGTPYYMHKALQSRDIQLINLGFPKKPSLLQKISKKAQSKISSLGFKSPSPTEKYKTFAEQVQKQLKKTTCDVIFAPVASGELSFLETNIPIVYLSDATPSLINECYKNYSDSEEFAIHKKQELTAIKKAQKLVYSSNWAANSAIHDYQAEPDKIEVIPFGANLDSVPLIDEISSKFNESHCRLLFVGVDWHRKGGIIALETLISLLNQGIDAELFVVGCVPPDEIKHERLTVIPFLNKNIPQQQDELNKSFLQSHFLLFPTRADCSPIAICEANAFGLPVIATETGGIPTIINNGKNGYMLPMSASGDDYASLIVKNLYDQTSYQQLILSSREEYETRLNWNKWAKSLHQVMISMFN